MLSARRLIPFTALTIVLAIAALLHLAFGARALEWHVVWDAVLSSDYANPLHNIVLDMRMPRLFSALIVGGALGLAGILLQGLTENPLADPGLLGINSGAAFFVVGGLLLVPNMTLAMIPLLAFSGAVVATSFVLLNAGVEQHRARLILSGVVISALFSALTSTILLMDQQGLDTLRRWLVGSLAFETSEARWHTLPLLILACGIAVFNIPGLNLYRLGSHKASLLGLNIGRFRLSILLSTVLLSASSVAIAGPIGFVGLVAPHVGRLLFGNDHRTLVVAAPLLGALMVVIGDTVARVVVRPLELNTGIVTALVGAPVFIALVLRRLK
ncbi:iron ABC transporter permease [Agrobacterium sp.]|jgi:iron complex transport system permease protein|uniref:FecCD family ABC transporter permease n=1 Tax=Agrobacterium sp. TaxID=361 RepID=UPI0028AE41A3